MQNNEKNIASNNEKIKKSIKKFFLSSYSKFLLASILGLTPFLALLTPYLFIIVLAILAVLLGFSYPYLIRNKFPLSAGIALGSVGFFAILLSFIQNDSSSLPVLFVGVVGVMVIFARSLAFKKTRKDLIAQNSYLSVGVALIMGLTLLIQSVKENFNVVVEGSFAICVSLLTAMLVDFLLREIRSKSKHTAIEKTLKRLEVFIIIFGGIIGGTIGGLIVQDFWIFCILGGLIGAYIGWSYKVFSGRTNSKWSIIDLAICISPLATCSILTWLFCAIR